MARSAEVIIIGAGVVGCSVAYHLARAGVKKVVVFERGKVGGEASGEAAGMLAAQCEAHAPGPFLDLCLAGRAAFDPLAEELKDLTGIDIEYLRWGTLYLVEEGEAEARYEWQKRRGLRVEKLAPEEVWKLEPGLKKDIPGALYFPDDHHVHNGELTQALAQAAQVLGVEVREGCPVLGFLRNRRKVTGVRTPEGVVLGETVVLCAGPWSGELGACLGRPIPVGPAKGQLIASELPSLPLRHIVYTKEGYLVPRLRGELITGSTVEFVGFDKRVTFAGLKKLVELALDLLPGLKEQLVARAWAGLRPYTPDALPIIGPLPELKGVFVATGHFRNGILLGPITGRLIRELILGEALSLPLETFSPTRFDGKGQENR